MNNIELKNWIENMNYNLRKLDAAKANINHIILVTKKDISFLKRILSKSKLNGGQNGY